METDTLVGGARAGVVGHQPAGRASRVALRPAALQTVSTEPGDQVGVSQVAALVLFIAGGQFGQD